MTPARYKTRQVANYRWVVWDTATGAPHAFYKYKSKHKCNRACDKLNGMSMREGIRYRIAKEGE